MKTTDITYAIVEEFQDVDTLFPSLKISTFENAKELSNTRIRGEVLKNAKVFQEGGFHVITGQAVVVNFFDRNHELSSTIIEYSLDEIQKYDNWEECFEYVELHKRVKIFGPKILYNAWVAKTSRVICYKAVDHRLSFRSKMVMFRELECL